MVTTNGCGYIIASLVCHMVSIQVLLSCLTWKKYGPKQGVTND